MEAKKIQKIKKIKSNIKLTLLYTVVGCIFFAVVGFGWSWFRGEVDGNETAETYTAETANLSIVYQDSPEVTLDNAMPGSVVTKTFTVKNTGEVTTTYNMNWDSLFNEFVDRSDLEYKVESIDNSMEYTEVPGPGSHVTMMEEIEIDPDETHTYTLTVRFINKNENQSDNEGKKVSGRIEITEGGDVRAVGNTYTVHYNSNGGTGTMNDSVHTYGRSSALNENEYTKENYTFVGWSKNSNAEDPVFEDKEDIGALTSVDEGIVNLYAVWDENINYTVKYDANDGYMLDTLNLNITNETNHWTKENGVYKSGNYHVSSSISTITSEEFTLDTDGVLEFDYAVSGEVNCDYLYYEIYKDGSTTPMSDTGTSTKITRVSGSDTEENIPYIHVIKELEEGRYIISFKYTKNSGINSGLDKGYVKNIKVSNFETTMQSTLVDNTVDTYLRKNEYKRYGYDFLGWSKNENATAASYDDEGKAYRLTKEDDGEVTLYAIWKKHEYDVKLNIVNGESSEEAVKQVIHGEGTTFTTRNNEGYSGPQLSCNISGPTVTEEGLITINNVKQDIICTLTYRQNPLVTVSVINGTVDVAQKRIGYNKYSDTFNITETLETDAGVYGGAVSCSGSTGTYEDGVLTVSNVTAWNPSCTVEIVDEMTTLYEDGTFILNEQLEKRKENILKYGNVEKEYAPFNTRHSYVWGDRRSREWHDDSPKVRYVYIDEEIHPTSTAYWFYNFNMYEGYFSNLQMEKCINMFQMFYRESFFGYVSHVELYGLENWNVSNVKNMGSSFSNLGGSASEYANVGDLSNWDTSNVTSMSGMFHALGAYSNSFYIGELDDWDVSNVTNMSYMFCGIGENDENWSIGDLSKWNVSKVKDFSYMFGIHNSDGAGRKKFDIGDLSNWDTTSVTTMYEMFCRRSSALNSNIGTLQIPNNCELGSLTYSNDLIANGFVFNGTAKNPNINNKYKLNYYYANDTAKSFVESIVGTDKIGNIYNKGLYTPQYVTINVTNGTVRGASTRKVPNGIENTDFHITGNEGYFNPTVSCTNSQTASIMDGILSVTNVTSDTTCTVTYS